MTETQLAASAGQAVPDILANEGIIYLIRINGLGLLKDAGGANRVFKSATAAGTVLAAMGFESAQVVHQCAYDEVIGHEPLAPADRFMKTPMDLSGLKPLV